MVLNEDKDTFNEIVELCSNDAIQHEIKYLPNSLILLDRFSIMDDLLKWDSICDTRQVINVAKLWLLSNHFQNEIKS